MAERAICNAARHRYRIRHTHPWHTSLVPKLSAWERGEEVNLVVVPRLVVRLANAIVQPPMSAEVWETTRLSLPTALAGRSFRNIFTGEVLTAENHNGTSGLSLSAVLGAFPVAFLECCPPETPLA